ncbi:hypothetical protein Tco_1354626 [Tanacetum coccineum]
MPRTMGTNDDEVGSSRSKRSRHETVEEVFLPQVHHEFLLWEGCNRDAKSRYNTRLAQLLPRHIYSPCLVNWDVLNRMGCDGEINDMLRIKRLIDSDGKLIPEDPQTGVPTVGIPRPLRASMQDLYDSIGFPIQEPTTHWVCQSRSMNQYYPQYPPPPPQKSDSSMD